MQIDLIISLSCKRYYFVHKTELVCEMGADPQTITAGQGTALWWYTENAISASVDNGIGDVTLPTQYVFIYPTETTTYTMTATGADGTVNCDTTITVE